MSLVPIEDIAEIAGGVTTGYIHKCSDPDDEKEISAHRALLIDVLCFKARGVAPFRDLFADQLIDAPPATCLKEYTLISQTALGELSRAVMNATAPASDGGAKLTPRELQTIMVEVQDLEAIIDAIKRAVTAASKPV